MGSESRALQNVMKTLDSILPVMNGKLTDVKQDCDIIRLRLLKNVNDSSGC